MSVAKLHAIQAIARRFLFHCKTTLETPVQGDTSRPRCSFLDVLSDFCGVGYRAGLGGKRSLGCNWLKLGLRVLSAH